MATSIHSQVHSPSLNPSQICSPSMESQTHAAAEKKEAGMLQMEILEKLKHEAVSGSHDPQFLAEQLANYHKLQRSMGISDTALGAQAAELFKREALFSSLRPKLDYFNMAALQEQQLMASTQNRMNAPPSPPRRSDTPSSSEDGGSISPNHAPPSAGGQWTYEEQFKQLYELGDEPDRRQFLDDLFAFMQKRGTPVNRIPIMAKQTLDMYKLFKLVVSKGGLVEVINKKLWREITKGLNLPSSITSAAFTLRTQYMKYIYPYECEKYDFSKASELQAAIDGNRREGRRPGYGYDMTSPGAMPPFYNPQTFPAANPFFNPAMMNTSVANILSGQLNGYMNGTGLGGQMSHPRLSAPPAFPGIPPEMEERSQSPINVASPLAGSNQSEMSRQDQPMNSHYTQAGSPAKRQRCMSPLETDIALAPAHAGSFSREAADGNLSLRRSTSQSTISNPVRDTKSLSTSKTRLDASPPIPTHIEVSDKDETNGPSVTVSIEVNGVSYRGVLFAQK